MPKPLKPMTAEALLAAWQDDRPEQRAAFVRDYLQPCGRTTARLATQIIARYGWPACRGQLASMLAWTASDVVTGQQAGQSQDVGQTAPQDAPDVEQAGRPTAEPSGHRATEPTEPPNG